MTTTAVLPPQQDTQEKPAAPPRAESRWAAWDRLAFHAAPLLFAAACYASGIGLAHLGWFAPAILAFAALALALTAALALRRPTRVAYLPIGALWLLVGIFAAEMQPQPPQQTALASLADGAPHSVTAEVAKTGPVRRITSYAPFSDVPREELTRSAELRIRTVSGATGPAIPVSGGVRLSIYSPISSSIPAFACGDTLQGEITLRRPERYRDPGVWDSSAWLLSQGIGVLGSAKAAGLTVLRNPRKATLPCRLHSLQQAWSERLLDYASAPHRLPPWLTLSSDDAAMLTATVTGDRTWLGKSLRSDFERTGSFHLLVVSGLHLGLFSALIFRLGRALRLPPLLTTVLTITLATAYALLTGFGQPVQRALAMVALYLIGRLLFRERRGLNALGFAALCLLVLNPRSLFDTGLQMTLLSVIAIAGIAAPVIDRTFGPYLDGTRHIDIVALDPAFPPLVAQFRVTLRLFGSHLTPTRRRQARRGQALLAGAARLLLRIVEVVFVSAVIELTMALPMAAYFHRVTVFGIPVNILVVPALGLLLPCAFITLFALLLAPGLATVPAACTAAVLHSITGTVHLFSHLNSGDVRVPGPSPLAATASLFLLVLSAWSVRRTRAGVRFGLLAAVAAGCIVLAPRTIARQPHTLEVTAIDVGQGDALLVVSPSGKTLLIDAGGRAGSAGLNQGNFETGEDVVSPYLWSRGIRRLDAVALTHAHSDHMGGMPAVLRNFRPRQLWVGKNPDIPEYDALLAEARSLGIGVRQFSAGDAFPFGQTQVNVLAPSRDYRPGQRAVNNDSLVLHLAYGATSALLEGDAEAPSETTMLQESGLHADLLKVGHHGSKTSSTPAFLDAVSPRYAVISVGLNNSYHHPRWETLETLQDRHALTWRTDLLGLSTFYLDGTQVTPKK